MLLNRTKHEICRAHSRINAASESFKARDIFIFHHVTFYEQFFMLRSVEHENSFITLRPGFALAWLQCVEFMR